MRRGTKSKQQEREEKIATNHVPNTLYVDITMPKVRLGAIRQNLHVFRSSILALIAQIAVSHCPTSPNR